MNLCMVEVLAIGVHEFVRQILIFVKIDLAKILSEVLFVVDVHHGEVEKISIYSLVNLECVIIVLEEIIIK